MVSWHHGSTDSQMGPFDLSLQVTSGTLLSPRCRCACISIVGNRFLCTLQIITGLNNNVFKYKTAI